ncbi:MAG: HlyD family secretion protein [Bacteroidota bacterium]|nr:HlyD family secretion protein [Bacteroidota bacterium]
MDQELKKERNNKKGIKVYLPLIIVIIIVLLGCWYWYKDYTKYLTTDDAKIESDDVAISSKILGRIAHIYADEGDSVEKGVLIADLDSTDILAQKNQVMANRDQYVASKEQSEAKYKYDKESIKVLEVNLDKSKEDYERAKIQYSGDVITKEQFDHSKKAYEAAEAQYEAAKSQLDVSKAQINSAEASVKNAEAQLGVIETQLTNTRLYSPINGIIAKRWLLPGDIAQPGQSLFTLTNNHKYWVTAYMEETKISEIHLNQHAFYTIDAFSGVTFNGKVFFIGNNTASEFSLIPPNNASGNFTKVTQRIPVKISIDGTDKDPVKNYKILPGMSVVVKIVKQ